MISKPKADAAAMVRIEQLNKWFGNAHVLKNISWMYTLAKKW